MFTHPRFALSRQVACLQALPGPSASFRWTSPTWRAGSTGWHSAEGYSTWRRVTPAGKLPGGWHSAWRARRRTNDGIITASPGMLRWNRVKGSLSLPSDGVNQPDVLLTAEAITSITKSKGDAGPHAVSVTDHPFSEGRWLESVGSEGEAVGERSAVWGRRDSPDAADPLATAITVIHGG